MKKITTSIFTVLVSCSALLAQDSDMVTRWNQPVDPFLIVDNIYYVGTNEIASYLIAGTEGHVLIDGGFEETAPLIQKSIAALGFDVGDVKILLNSHAHFDHAAGLAELKEVSGAELYISEEDAEMIERGGKDDYLLGDMGLFPPVFVDHRLKDGETVALGDIKLTARITAGHTKGCTTWTMQAEHKDASLDVVIACSVSILPMARLLNDPSYPGIADDFKHTFEVFESLPCDVFLAAHGQFFDLMEKIELLKRGPAINPFIDPDKYKLYVAQGKKKLLERLEKERSEGG